MLFDGLKRAWRPSVQQILVEDNAVIASYLLVHAPAQRAYVKARLRGALPTRPTIRFVLSWETDANDVDLHVRDRNDGHAFYAQRDLPSGGRLLDDLTDGFGVDVVIDAVGRPETWKQAFYARDLAGTVVLVGVPTPDMRLDMPLVDFFSHGGSLKSSWYGDCLPERDFPTLVDLHLQGRLPLDKFVSERIGLTDIEEAFHKMHDGKVLRSVVVL